MPHRDDWKELPCYSLTVGIDYKLLNIQLVFVVPSYSNLLFSQITSATPRTRTYVKSLFGIALKWLCGRDMELRKIKGEDS